MHPVVASEQIVTDRYHIVESACCGEEQDDEQERCDDLAMVLLDGCGHR
jgi:hypothetical protein